MDETEITLYLTGPLWSVLKADSYESLQFLSIPTLPKINTNTLNQAQKQLHMITVICPQNQIACLLCTDGLMGKQIDYSCRPYSPLH